MIMELSLQKKWFPDMYQGGKNDRNLIMYLRKHTDITCFYVILRNKHVFRFLANSTMFLLHLLTCSLDAHIFFSV